MVDNLTPEQEQFTQGYISPPDEVFSQAAQKYGRGDPEVFAKILKGQFGVESNYGRNTNHVQPKTGVPSGAMGPMGLMPALIKKYGVTDPSDLSQSVNAAAQYLAEGYDRTGNLLDALRYYHGGPDKRQWGQYTNMYPAQVAAKAEVPLPTVSQIRSSVKPEDVDSFVDSFKLPPMPGDEAMKLTVKQPVKGTAPAAAPVPVNGTGPWSGEKELANSLLLGQGPRVVAGLKWLGGDEYGKTLKEQEDARNQWTGQNPGQALGIDLAGGLAPTVLGLGAGAAGIKAAAGGAARLLPQAEPALTAVGRFLGGTAGAAGKGVTGVLTRGASRAASGAVQGGAAGTLESDLFSPSTGDQAKSGALTGMVLNPILAPVAEDAARLLTTKTGIAPSGTVDPEAGKIATAAQKLGVNLRGGQITSDPHIQALDAAHIPAEDNLRQISDFHKALGKTFGVDADHFTPEVLGKARKDIGDRLNDIGSRSDIKFDQQGFQDLNKLWNAAKTDPTLTDFERSQLKDTLTHLAKNVASNGATLAGKTYGQFTSYGGPLGVLTYSKSPALREYGEALQDALDNTRERVNPGIGKEWLDARNQWKNLRVAENWVKNSPTGQGNPKTLLSVVKSFYPSVTSSDIGDVGTLARAGKYLPTPTVQGGVVTKAPLSVKEAAIHNPLLGGGIGLMALEGAHEAWPLISEHPFAAAAAAAGVVGRHLVKKAAQNRLTSALSSPEYTERLLKGTNGQSYFVNPLLPLMPRSTDEYGR